MEYVTVSCGNLQQGGNATDLIWPGAPHTSLRATIEHLALHWVSACQEHLFVDKQR